jgi:hypothetical protein
MKPLMRLLIEIATAALIVICIAASSAAFAAGKMGRLPPAKRNTRRALRRHQAPMRRQVLCERVRGQVDVGGELRGANLPLQRRPGESQDPLPRLLN